MSANAVIYDALTMPVVDTGMVGVAIFTFLGALLVGARAWRKAPHSAPVAFMKFRQTQGPASLVAILALGFLIYAGVETLLWRFDYTHHRYTILDGCVAGFGETVQRNHDLGVDNFSLQGRSFRVSDSGWRLGYHRSSHHGSPIQVGAHLRAFAHGGLLLRIEREAPPARGRRP